MIVGFTGTRSGMNETQRIRVAYLLSHYEPTTAIHGGCVGADFEFHQMCVRLGITPVIYPGHFASNPNDDRLKADLDYSAARPSKNHLARNRDIVTDCDVLIACPYTSKPAKGGTWYTINYARKHGRELFLVTRDANKEDGE